MLMMRSAPKTRVKPAAATNSELASVRALRNVIR